MHRKKRYMIENSKRNKNLLFTLAYSMILISIVYFNTYLPGTNIDFIKNLLMGCSIILISLKIFLYDLTDIDFTKINVKKAILFALICFFTLITVKNRYKPPFLVFLFVIGSYKIDFNKIVKIYFYTVGLILLVSIFSSSLGLIENSKITRDGVLRQAFGYKYPTAFVNILNTVFMAEIYYYFNSKKVKISGILIRDILYLIAAIITLKLCDTRADSAITMLLIPISLYIYCKSSKKYSKLINKLMGLSFFIFGFFTYLVVTEYINNPKQPFLDKLDIMLSRRLALTAYAVQKYGYSLIGKKIISGDIVNGQYTFYLDSNYYIFFLGYGIILFVLVGIIYYSVVQRELKKHNLAFVIFLMVLAFMGAIEEHFYAVETNPFLLATLAWMGASGNIRLEYGIKNKELV